MYRRGYFTKYLVRYTPAISSEENGASCKMMRITTMRKTLLVTAALLALATPALADAKGDKIAACVAEGAVRTIDGKQYALRPNDDFRVVHNAAYNQYGVTWKQRIQADQAWAFAAEVAKKCINETTGQVANNKKD